MLADVIRFHLPDTYAPAISARRSPQLTNGYSRAGAAEKQWEKGMPLGDIFTHLMVRAWNAQEQRERISMNPKYVLVISGMTFLG